MSTVRLQTAPTTSQSLLRALEVEVPRGRVSPLYVLGLLVVAVAMVLLPLVYLGVVALVAWATYYHVTENASIVIGGHNRETRARLLVYVGPIVVGAVLLLFMVKPIFARPAFSRARHRVLREREPLLFEFVERLAALVGAPPPREIWVDAEVNASAGFRRGFLSFLGRDLVLTLGLPLMAGLSLKQLVNVLAHEFGHFSQGTAMRLTYVIGSINGWFARVVYERDKWDEWLIASAEGGGFVGIRLVAYTARLFVWLTRKMLWVLMHAGHAISCMMMRQMEYDADACAVRVVGSDTFVASTRQICLLDSASAGAMYDLRQQYGEGMLPDDMVSLVVQNIRELRSESITAVDTHMEEGRAGLFSTHPATSSRVSAARALGVEGVFDLDEPATVLLKDFDHLSRTVTLLKYEELIGPEAHQIKLISSSRLADRKATDERQLKAFREYFGETFTPMAPPEVTRNAWAAAASTSAVDLAKELHTARRQIEANHTQAARFCAACKQARDRSENAEQALLLIRAGVKVDAASFGLAAATADAAHEASRQAARRLAEAEEKLGRFNAVLTRRLVGALRLLTHPRVAERVQGAHARLAEADRLVECLSAMAGSLHQVGRVRQTMGLLNVLFARFQDSPNNEKLRDFIGRKLTELQERLGEARDGLMHVPYPFEHAQPDMSVGRFGAESVPGEPAELHDAASGFVDRVPVLYCRVLGQLAATALDVEKALSLKPLDLPQEAPAADAG